MLVVLVHTLASLEHGKLKTFDCGREKCEGNKRRKGAYLHVDIKDQSVA